MSAPTHLLLLLQPHSAWLNPRKREKRGEKKRDHSPSTSRHDPRENTSKSVKPSGKGYEETILNAILAQQGAAVTDFSLLLSPILYDVPQSGRREPAFKGAFHVKSMQFIM